MKNVRGFKFIKGYKDEGIRLPERSTSGSAGYDIRAVKTVTIPSQRVINDKMTRLAIAKEHPADREIYSITVDGDGTRHKHYVTDDDIAWHEQHLSEQAKPVLVPTGVKAYFPKDEVLYLFNRSSNPLKRGLYLANGTGVIDSDYYDNPSNEGQLFAQFINLGWHDYTIHKGDRIMQGVFEPYMLADNDHADGVREGGLGSTGKE